MAEWTGLEPATPGVTGRYSNQLNYHSAVGVTVWTKSRSVRFTGYCFSAAAIIRTPTISVNNK